MAEQRPHVLYTKQLIRKGHGYPLWYPEPDSSGSTEYRREGVSPGDVGILNDIGGFNFLFNIFRDADDPINGGNVPPGFQPLHRPTARDVQHIPACYGCIVSSTNVSCTEISMGASIQGLPSIMGAGASFDFSVSDESAAVLCLPDHAKKCENLNKALIEEYARSNGISWYHYINHSEYLGRQAPNGSLYVVTGCDKTTSWGTAAIAKADRSLGFSLNFTAGSINGDVRLRNSWRAGPAMDTRLYPLHSADYSYPLGLENQCIFSRGYTLSISGSLFDKSKYMAISTPINGSLKDKVPSFERKTPIPPIDENPSFLSRLISSFHIKSPFSLSYDMEEPGSDQRSRSTEGFDHGSESVAQVSQFPPRGGEILNPSAARNAYLLRKDPYLGIAITHDEEWMGVMQQYGQDVDFADEDLWCKVKDRLDPNISNLSSQAGVPSHAIERTLLVDNSDISDQAAFIQLNLHSEVEAPLSIADPQSPQNHIDGTRFWAVLIGIDAYPSSPLRGCVSDAMEMKNYLIEDLGVPGDRIQCLLGTEPYTSSIHPLSNYARRSLRFLKQRFYQTMGLSWEFPDDIPTRANIIDTLLSLSTNSQIQTGDNIIIYFAGYGSRYSHYNYRNISGWRSYINALCPIDRAVLNNCEVPDISDLEMDIILNEISRTKGHRITFILDSCHCRCHRRFRKYSTLYQTAETS